MMKPPTHLNNHHTIVPSVEVRLVVYIVDNVLVSGVEEIIRMKFVFYAVMKLKNHSLMIQIQILSLILQIFSTHLHNPRHILNCPSFYDNDDEDDDKVYTIAITPVLPTVEPDNSLSMGDEHLSTIPKKKESSVKELIPIPSESKGISDSMYDVPFCENSHPLDALKDHSEIFFDPNDDYASSDDDPLYSEDIDYVDASPPDFELDDILREKLLNINLLIAKIEALKDNPTLSTDSVLKSPSSFPNSFLEENDTSDNSLPESEIFCFDMEEKSCVSFPSGTRNKIFDPGIFIEVQSKRFLSPNELSISFIRDPLSPVFDTLLPFSSKNEKKVFNPGSLSSNEEKSPHLLSHRGFNPSKIKSDFSESPMMISGGPFLS
ncbi:hypothetical protein Tco_0502542 [Tanacetum coccineum]